MDLGSAKGTYVLIFKAIENFQCRVGRLGLLNGKAGCYVYVGSAFGPGGIAARVRHHLSIAEKPHWHLDYLRPYLQPSEIWVSDSLLHLEHQWADTLLQLSGAVIPFRGFGSTDCKCQAHLIYFLQAPGFKNFSNRHQGEVKRGILGR